MKKINETTYKYKGVIINKCPNGLYTVKFLVKDFNDVCYLSAWDKEELKAKFNQFVDLYGGLEMDKFIQRKN